MRRFMIALFAVLALSSISIEHIDNEGYVWRSTLLSDFLVAPVESSYRPTVVKSVQCNTITTTAGTGTATLSPAVNTANTVLHYGGSRGASSGSNDASLWNARITLTDSTTVTATANGSNTVVSFCALEYYGGILKSVQRTTANLSGTHPVDVAITAVTLAKSVVGFLGLSTSVTDGVSHVFPTLVLTSTTNVRAQVGANVASSSVAGIQVTEFR